MRLALVLAVLLVPLASAQWLLEDPAGDVEASSYNNSSGAPGNWQAVDLLALGIVEEPEDLLFTVDIEGLPDCEGGQCINAGDLRTYFQYGELGYYVQQGVDALGNAYGQLHSVTPGGVDGPAIATNLGATLDIQDSSVTAKVPRDLIVDEAGTPPIKDRSITHILTRSYSQFSFGGPDVTNSGSDDMLVIRDQMGFDAPANFTFQFGGSTFQGTLQALSPAPFRASNGGAATYRYDINLLHTGDAETTLDIKVEGLPQGWSFQRPNGTLTVGPATQKDFAVLIHTPSGHQHGGSDVFHIAITDAGDKANWARVELGVHYLSVPQPAGHHPTLWLHSLSDGTIATATALFGNDGGRIWMNTLEEDPGDEQVPIVGQEGVGGFQAQTTRWSICMIPNLRLGLDMDLSQTGRLEVPIGGTAPHTGVQLTGRLLHIAGPEPLDFCDPSLYNRRDQAEIARFDGGATQDILNNVQSFTLTATPLPAGDYIPYEPGAQLVLELEATFTGGDPGPGGLAIHPGGRLDLPLLEYYDASPPGLIGGQIAGNGTDIGTFEDEPAEAKESPVGWFLLPLLLAILAKRRN